MNLFPMGGNHVPWNMMVLGSTMAFTIWPSEVASSPKVCEIVSGCVLRSAISGVQEGELDLEEMMDEIPSEMGMMMDDEHKISWNAVNIEVNRRVAGRIDTMRIFFSMMMALPQLSPSQIQRNPWWTMLKVLIKVE